EQGIAEAHARGKKLFVTSNILPHNDKVRTYMRDIEPVIAMRPARARSTMHGCVRFPRRTRWN
ncbi:MAG: U32 family peptidase, partial [Brachymonas sp.]|nr:U32 family peptidase [Brachymonas sp.]